MKKFLAIALISAAVLAGYKEDNPEPVPEVNILDKIPDVAFRAYIAAQTGWDTNNSGIISLEEAATVTTIDVSGAYNANGSIASLAGVEYFTALTNLSCSYNQLETLDLSNNTALINLACSYNQLETIDVSGCTSLKNMVCNYNQLETLDVSNNTRLTGLRCSGNKQLETLDVSNNIALTTLYCDNSSLNALDVSGCTALTILACSSNQIKTLDVSNNAALIVLSCDLNPGDGVSKFPVTAGFDNDGISNGFTTGSWSYNSKTITIDYSKAN